MTNMNDVNPGDFVAYAAPAESGGPALHSGVLLRPPTSAESSSITSAISLTTISYWVMFASGSAPELVVVSPDDWEAVVAAVGGVPSGVYGPVFSLIKKTAGNEAGVIAAYAPVS